MKIIRNNIIPFKGFAAINIFGFLFVRNHVRITDRLLNHEEIHTAQMKEMLFIFFYVWYLLEWILKGFRYSAISFEKEAYTYQYDPTYLSKRKHYHWIKRIFQK